MIYQIVYSGFPCKSDFKHLETDINRSYISCHMWASKAGCFFFFNTPVDKRHRIINPPLKLDSPRPNNRVEHSSGRDRSVAYNGSGCRRKAHAARSTIHLIRVQVTASRNCMQLRVESMQRLLLKMRNYVD